MSQTDAPQTRPPDLPPRYDAAAVQEAVARVWEEENLFHAEPSDGGEPYCIVIPPPNVTAALHLGHALNNTIQDILVRRARMQGKNAVWIPGTDHAGIATQTVVDKRLQAEGQPNLKDYKRLEAEGKNGREQFIEKVQAWKDEYEEKILGQLKAMGCSCDWERTAFTMDEQRAKAVREAFFRLFKDGLIYRGKRLVNWDPVTQTALADDEVENEEIDGHFYYLKYPLAEETEARSKEQEPEYVTVATTRPETMLGDTAVAINPKDPRAESLRGRFVRLPIVNRVIPIVEDDYVVMPGGGGDESGGEDPKAKFATGFLKVTPAHDPNDWEIGQRHGLPVINVMAPDASISDQHGWPKEDFEQGEASAFLGMDRYEARRAIVAWFRENNLLEDVKPHRHSVGHSYRSHVPVEPYLSDQWYVAVKKPIPWMADSGVVEGTDVPKNSLAGLALTALEDRGTGFQPVSEKGSDDRQDACPTGSRVPSGSVAGDGALSFIPDRYAKTFHDWNAGLRDWCISRQLWWGHRIPVWEVKNYCPGPVLDTFLAHLDQEFHWPEGTSATVVCARTEKAVSYFSLLSDVAGDITSPDDAARKVSLHGTVKPEAFPKRLSELKHFAGEFPQDPDVLDTWFSSALWPMSTLGWPERTAALETWNPTSVLCTAREIITLWVSRMVMFNRYMLAHPDQAAEVGSWKPEAGQTPANSQLPTSDFRLPFKHVFIHAMIQDGEGRKMSKSLGNGVDPLDIIATHGADAMRFTLAQMTTQTQDVRMPVVPMCPHCSTPFEPSGHVLTKSPWRRTCGECGKQLTVPGMGHADTPDAPMACNTSPKFDLGRNFANKLWNAGRFVIGSLESPRGTGYQPVSENPAALDHGQVAHATGTPSAPDRWILSRLAHTVEAVNRAIDEYRFDRYATACYDFFWRDFCDWYVEATKPAMKQGGPQATQTAQVLATCLDVSLRLLHPVIPFATERLWWALGDVMPERGIPGRIMGCMSDRIIRAAWPAFDEPMASLIDPEAEQALEQLQEIVQAIRTVRTENKVEPRRTVPVTIRATGQVAGVIEQNRATVELWAGCELVGLGGDVAEPDGDGGGAAKTTAAGCEIFVAGVVDTAAEAGRVAREKADLEKKIKTLQGRLANKGYTEKAPVHLVQQTRDELAQAEAELAKLG